MSQVFSLKKFPDFYLLVIAKRPEALLLGIVGVASLIRSLASCFHDRLIDRRMAIRTNFGLCY